MGLDETINELEFQGCPHVYPSTSNSVSGFDGFEYSVYTMCGMFVVLSMNCVVPANIYTWNCMVTALNHVGKLL